MTECQTSRLQDAVAELQEENERLRELCKASLDRMLHDECGDPLTHEEVCYCTDTDTGYGTLVCLPCKLRAALGDSR